MEANNPYQAPTADLDETPAFNDSDRSSVLSASGRFGRLSYVAWYMLLMILSWVAMMLVGGAGFGLAALSPGGLESQGAAFPLGISVFLILISLVMLYFSIVFSSRRLHDMNLRGWWLLLMFIPVVNVIFTLVILLARGSAERNRFGPPRATPVWEKVVGYLGIAFFAVWLVAMIASVGIPAYNAYIQAAGA